MTRVLAAALVALFLLAACSGDDATPEDAAPAEPAEDAMRRFIDAQTKGQWVRLYADLHPAHQSLVSEDEFAACQESAGIPVEMEIIETYEEEITIPGTDIRSDSLALTYELSAEIGGETDARTLTSHVIDVDGQWRWYLSDPAQCLD